MELPLTALKINEVGIIKSIRSNPGHGKGRAFSWGFKKRLMDMGLTPGTKIVVLNSAPFNGPVEISVRGSKHLPGRPQ